MHYNLTEADSLAGVRLFVQREPIARGHSSVHQLIMLLLGQ